MYASLSVWLSVYGNMSIGQAESPPADRAYAFSCVARKIPPSTPSLYREGIHLLWRAPRSDAPCYTLRACGGGARRGPNAVIVRA